MLIAEICLSFVVLLYHMLPPPGDRGDPAFVSQSCRLAR